MRWLTQGFFNKLALLLGIMAALGGPIAYGIMYYVQAQIDEAKLEQTKKDDLQLDRDEFVNVMTQFDGKMNVVYGQILAISKDVAEIKGFLKHTKQFTVNSKPSTIASSCDPDCVCEDDETTVASQTQYQSKTR